MLIFLYENDLGEVETSFVFIVDFYYEVVIEQN